MPAFTSRLPRRDALVGILASAASFPLVAACGSGVAQAKAFPIQRSETDWRKRLSPAQFRILRQHGTERPFSSPLNDENEPESEPRKATAGADQHHEQPDPPARTFVDRALAMFSASRGVLLV